MSKDTYYFQHDYNARNDEKILELRAAFGPAGYGIFWMLIETMAENENAGINQKFITGLSISYGIAKAELCNIISFCIGVNLFYEEAGFIFSKRLLKHMDFRQEKSNERVSSGRKGAETRWRSHSSAIANDGIGKERKGKEIKGISFSEDKKSCVLSDGTIQELTKSQLQRMKEGGFEPHFVKKGETD